MTEPYRKRYTSGDWVIIIAAVGALGVGLINAWQGERRDDKLQVIETNTNSRLTKQDNMLVDLRESKDSEIKELREELQTLKIERATSQERENPTESDGSAK